VSPPTGKTPAGEEPADDIEYADPGLARERTELAWTRTAIAFAALGAALLKFRPVVGLLVLVLSAVVWRLGRLSGTASTADLRARLDRHGDPWRDLRAAPASASGVYERIERG